MLTDARLTQIANMLPRCRVIADIGCDHGRLGARLLLEGKCETMWFSDISAPSLEKAKVLVDRLGIRDRAEFFVGDGANAFPYAPDCAVISGMGGVTISEIIKNANGKLENTRLIMEPNVGDRILRKTLMDEGYAIVDERVVRAGRRFYILIDAQKGKYELSEEEQIAGPIMLKNMDGEFYKYALFRARVSEKALMGAKKSENADTEELEYELSVWKGVLKKYVDF